MNEIKSFLNSKLVRKILYEQRSNQIACTKVKLTEEDFSTKSYCQFKEIPNEKIINLIDRYFSLDSESKFESMFPSVLSWEMHISNQQDISKDIESMLLAKKISGLNVDKMIHCLDELVTNSLFATNPQYKANKQVRQSQEFKTVEIKVFVGVDFNAIVVRDYYGLFDQKAQLATFGKELNSQYIVNTESGAGAGVGLQIVRELSSLLIFRQKPNQWTESAVFFVKNCHASAPLVFEEV